MTLGIGDSHVRSLKPKRYNMKKEPEEVQRFVHLMTTPIEENTIDDQIDHFKGLSVEKRKQLMETLEKKGNSIKTEQPLVFKILTMNLPSDVQQMILAKYNSLQTMDTSSGEYFKFRNWLEKVTSIPFGIYKEIPARIEDGAAACTAFMERAKKCMQQALYGQEDAKLQILQFIASKITNPTARGLSLLLVGPPGIGKTSLIKNGIAKALDWPFQFISLGGDSDATTYTGHQLVYEGSHCGKIVNSIVGAKSMSMVLMFDELDKISGTAKGEEVQNMLIHLTDPVQNADFEDKYLSGVPIDLSRVMFVFSGNDINKIDKVLLDRMIVVQLEGYSSKEKQVIAEQYLIPGALNETNLNEKVRISSEVIQHIISEYAGEEKGVRELKRSIDQIVQRINMLRIFNSKDLPFHIKDFSLPFVLKKEHIDLFLKKKDTNESIRHLYA
jgi:ATP-dependent Lon protease